jgi:hypothetical protein
MSKVPQVCSLLYADDRTIIGTEEEVHQVEEIWNEFCDSNRMRTNHAKTQRWELTATGPNAGGEVLGCVWAPGSDSHQAETKRWQSVVTAAERIATLPIAINQRGDLAKAMLTTKQVWSQFITGRRTEELHKNWAQTFRRACLHHPGGRSSRSIRFSNQLYKKLVKLLSSLGGDAVAVAVGGMSTPATASRVPQVCPYCMGAMVPSVDHILWFCSWEPFVKARVLQRPLSDFVARMGWDLTTPRDESFALLTQMGEIRALESAARRRARRL